MLLTKKQWKNMFDFPSPTASKVAKTGERNPYNAPAKMLPAIPRTGHKPTQRRRQMHRKNFRSGPNNLVLPVTEINNMREIKKQ